MAVNEAMLINAGLQARLVSAETVSRLRPVARAQRLAMMDVLTRELRMPPSAFWRSAFTAACFGSVFPHKPHRCCLCWWWHTPWH